MEPKPQIYIGTSGWSYPKGEGTWKVNFYPSGTKNELIYYSRFFDTVEINSSFYRPPDPAVAEKWVNATPEGFLFSVKLWQKFTHPKMYEATTGKASSISAGDVELFTRGIEPLFASGKMGMLLVQFPPGFINDDYGQRILHAVVNTFGKYPLAVELRHRSWSNDESTEKVLKQAGASWVQIDEPKFSSSISSDIPITSNTAYFRFHGRNAKDWWRGNVETRYKYLYSPEEISHLARQIKTACQASSKVFAYFNNHYQAFAPRNSVQLIKALQLPFKELPGGNLPAEE